MWRCLQDCVSISLLLCTIAVPCLSQLPNGNLFRRVSRSSNFEFAVYNNGMLFGDWSLDGGLNGVFAPPLAFWPRGSFHLWASGGLSGLVFLAKKNGRLLVSDAGFIRAALRSHGPFNQTVPGRIGDQTAGYDSTFGGAGWKYVDNPDYIVYSSLDYDSTGVDTTGANFNDWPIREVNGAPTYVAEPTARARYKPVFRSDEDMFFVFKDTDTRADQLYDGPNGPSIPIGIEVHNTVFTWRNGPGRDIVLFQQRVFNKSGVALESCYVAFGFGHSFWVPSMRTISRSLQTYLQERWRNLCYLQPTPGTIWREWTATPIPPTIGYTFLETPRGYGGMPLGLTYGACGSAVSLYKAPPPDTIGTIYYDQVTDSILYRTFSNPRFEFGWDSVQCDFSAWAVPITGPFPLGAGESTTAMVGIIFSDSLQHLLLLHDFITRVYANNFQRPSSPSLPRLSATGLNRAIKLTWDARAESSTDIIIPDSLGRPFIGYKLLRAEREEGPYVQIGRWFKDSVLVHEYLDRGEDVGGLKNNVRYYYKLLAFDEGAKRLKLDTMETSAVKGVNWQSVVPTTEPSNATSTTSDGALASGTLGNVSLPKLVPTNPTNFNNLISGRQLRVRVVAATDGVKYTLPVIITDTIAGRVHNAILDPKLLVHGNATVAGIRESTLTVTNIFGIGAANIQFRYRFEQLADSFRIAQPVIQGQADVPVLVRDSLNVTGVRFITPYTTAGREIVIELLPGGLDTVGGLFQRIFPYLNVKITDAVTGREYERNTEWQLQAFSVRVPAGPTQTTKPNRYYLSGTMSNGETWDIGHLLTFYESKIAFDFTDRGVGSGKQQPLFPWASVHRRGTRDFQLGDKVLVKWSGGVRAEFPREAVVTLIGGAAGRSEVTQQMMEGIKIVPNPYMVRHEAQRGAPRMYFNYLPEECTIRIYTVALDLVKTIHHSGGSREEWDLQTEGGQHVASQLLIAHIEATNGTRTVKKFAVVVGK